ncbi:MAG: putative metal-binding motif-containing protein [Myxococcota bacterium]
MLWVVLSGCSLLGLDDVTIASCEENVECEAANQRYPDRVDACTRYQCREGQCRLGPTDLDGDGESPVACGGSDCDDADAFRFSKAAERCDLQDNDCDEFIDEDIGDFSDAVVGGVRPVDLPVDGEPLFSPDERGLVVTDVVPIPSGGMATPPSNARWALVNASGFTSTSVPLITAANFQGVVRTCPELTESPFGSLPPEPTVPGATCTTHADCQDGDPCNGLEVCRPELPDADECQSAASPPCSATELCEPTVPVCLGVMQGSACQHQAARVVRSAGGAFGVATVDRRCGVSRSVRIGVIPPASVPDPDEPALLVSRDSVFDIFPGNGTSCDPDADRQIAEVALAAGAAGSNEFLVAWTVKMAAATCGTEGEVELVSATARVGDASTRTRTRPLAEPVRSDGGVALVPDQNRGWFLAYGASAGVFVGFQPTRERSNDDELPPLSSGTVLPLSSDAHHVTVLRDDEASSDAATELYFAWQEGCDGASIRGARVRFDRAAGRFTVEVPAVELLAGAREPSLVRTRQPFAVSDEEGGLIVAGIRNGTAVAVRARRSLEVVGRAFSLSIDDNGEPRSGQSQVRLFLDEEGVARSASAGPSLLSVRAACGPNAL